MATVSIKDQIKAANVGRFIKLRLRADRKGSHVIYLDYYNKGVRHVSCHGLEITMTDRVRDQETFRYACALRDRKELDILEGRSVGLETPVVDFREYALSLISVKRAALRKQHLVAINRFCRVFPRIRTSEISPEIAAKFHRSLAGLSSVTVDHYLSSMRYLCGHAIRDGYLRENPFADIRVKKSSIERQFLTIDEIRKIEGLPASPVRDAFLFSCYTGLRWGDVKALQMSDIRDGYLYYQMKKTGNFERMLIPPPAFSLLHYDDGLAFRLPGHRRMMKHLSAMIRAAGIDKHITFHCARHTFATLCLTLGIDIYTVSKLLGHADVRVTQMYARLVDSKKDAAMRMVGDALE